MSRLAREDWTVEGTWYVRNRSDLGSDNFWIVFGDFASVVESSVGDEDDGDREFVRRRLRKRES